MNLSSFELGRKWTMSNDVGGCREGVRRSGDVVGVVDGSIVGRGASRARGEAAAAR